MRAMQKIQCKFTKDIPDMGHLDGGSERDVRVSSSFRRVTMLKISLGRLNERAAYSSRCGWLTS